MTSISSKGLVAPPLYETRPGSTELVSATLDKPLKPIADGIWQSDGTSNSYLITTPEGDVVINTGLVIEGFIHGQKYARVSRAPVRVLIVTQAHIDHVGGLAAFAGPETEVIAHVNSAACQADDARIQGFRARRSPRFFPQPVLSEAIAHFTINTSGPGKTDKRYGKITGIGRGLTGSRLGVDLHPVARARSARYGLLGLLHQVQVARFAPGWKPARLRRHLRRDDEAL